MKSKIFIPFLLFVICQAKPQFQLTQKQAQQPEYKTCVPVTPISSGMNHLCALHILNVVKVYDAPIQQQFQFPQILVQKEPDGNKSLSVTVPGIGELKAPIDVSNYGRINIIHNMTVTGTLIDFEVPNFLLHGCGKVLGPEFQMALIMSSQTTLDAAYAAKVIPILQNYGISAE